MPARHIGRFLTDDQLADAPPDALDRLAARCRVEGDPAPKRCDGCAAHLELVRRESSSTSAEVEKSQPPQPVDLAVDLLQDLSQVEGFLGAEVNFDAMGDTVARIAAAQGGCDNSPSTEGELLDSVAWSKKHMVVVLDPDGWRADGLPFATPITEAEFLRRLGTSTAQRRVRGRAPRRKPVFPGENTDDVVGLAVVQPPPPAAPEPPPVEPAEPAPTMTVLEEGALPTGIISPMAVGDEPLRAPAVEASWYVDAIGEVGFVTPAVQPTPDGAVHNAAYVWSPGSYLREEMRERGYTKRMLMRALDVDESALDEILAGKRRLRQSDVRGLSAILGTSRKLWERLDAAWWAAKEARS